MSAIIHGAIEQIGQYILLIWDLGIVKFGDIATADPTTGHPLGQNNNVIADIFFEAKLRRDLGGEGVIVIDDLHVFNRDAALLSEIHQGRITL